MHPLVGTLIIVVALAVIAWTIVGSDSPEPAPRRRRARPSPGADSAPASTTAVVPAPVPQQVTLDRYRDRAIVAELRAHDLEVELSEARRALDAVCREMRIQAEQRAAAVAKFGQPIEVGADRARLKAIS